jgi:hypothetical protein
LVLDLPLILLGLPLAVIHANIEGLDGREDKPKCFRIQGCDVFLPRTGIRIVFFAEWVQVASAMFLMACLRWMQQLELGWRWFSLHCVNSGVNWVSTAMTVS